MWVLHSLQHLQLIVHHSLVALDILFEDNLDGILLASGFCLPYDAIRSCTERLSKLVLGPISW